MHLVADVVPTLVVGDDEHNVRRCAGRPDSDAALLGRDLATLVARRAAAARRHEQPCEASDNDNNKKANTRIRMN